MQALTSVIPAGGNDSPHTARGHTGRWSTGGYRGRRKTYILTSIITAGGYDSPHTRAAVRAEGALAAAADAALAEKAAKARLALAADHFNRDYKKGFQFLQVCNAEARLFQQQRFCLSPAGRGPACSLAPWDICSVLAKIHCMPDSSQCCHGVQGGRKLLSVPA